MKIIDKYYKIIIIIFLVFLMVAIINIKNNLQRIDKLEESSLYVLNDCMNDFLFSMTYTQKLADDMEYNGKTTCYSLREVKAYIMAAYENTQQVIRAYGSLNNSILSMKEDIDLLAVNSLIDEICQIESEKGKDLCDDVFIEEHQEKIFELFVFVDIFVNIMKEYDIIYLSSNGKLEVKQWCDYENIDLFYEALTSFLKEYSKYVQNNLVEQ